MNKKISLALMVTLFFSIAIPTMSQEQTIEQDPILFLHGLDGHASAWTSIISKFVNNGWNSSELFAYDFPNIDICSNEANVINAKAIKPWVDNILETTKSDKLDIISLSMGGISGRYYMKFLNGYEVVDDFVGAEPPNHGTTYDFGCDLTIGYNNSLFKSLNEGDETPGGFLNDTIGHRYDPIMDITYNGTHVEGAVNYTTIVSSDDDFIIPYNSTMLDGAYNIVVQGYSHIGLFSSAEFYNLIRNAVYDKPSATNTSSGFILVPSLIAFYAMNKKKRK